MPAAARRALLASELETALLMRPGVAASASMKQIDGGAGADPEGCAGRHEFQRRERGAALLGVGVGRHGWCGKRGKVGPQK